MYPCFGSAPQSSPSGSKAASEAGAQQHWHAASYRWTHRHLMAVCPGIPSTGLWHTAIKEECLELQAATSEPSKRDECYALSPEGICWSSGWRNCPHYGHYTLPGHSVLEHGLHLQLLEEKFKITALQVIFKGLFLLQRLFNCMIHPKFCFQQNQETQLDFLIEVQRLMESRAV